MRALVLATSLWLAACGSCGGDTPMQLDDAAPVVCEAPADRTGEATYYDADGRGNCSFPASPDDLMVAAANDTDYAGAAACGACAAVDGPGGSIVVRIVDRCPGCAAGDLDLSREAFAAIANPKAGRVAITWRWTACDVSGPLRFHWKKGTSEFWAGIQVRNHRHGIAQLEVKQGEAWSALRREPYNYFIGEGLGPGPHALRVTDVHGLVVEESGVAIGDDVERAGTGQLPACD